MIPEEAWDLVAGEGVWRKKAQEFEAKHGRKWRPVVRMDKALYGHPDAGALWERHCHKVLLGLGFKPVPNWGTCYIHPTKDLYLTVYVDDMQIAGPTANVDEMLITFAAVEPIITVRGL